MKQRFLLDVMVVMFAIKEVYEGDVPDRTCAVLLDCIAENCHGIVSDREVRRRYDIRISELFAQPSYQVRTALFLTGFVHNSQKFIIEGADPPEIRPDAARGIPPEDIYVVRAALISRPIIVTAERRLLNGVNRNAAALGLRAITPADALELAKQR